MRIDGYTKAVLTVIAGALVAIALNPWIGGGAWRSAVTPGAAEAQIARYELSVPRAFGKLVGFSNGNLLLEAPDGSLRVVDVDGKPPEYPKVKALVHWK